ISSAAPPTARLAHPLASPAAAKPAAAASSRITRAGISSTAPPTTRPSAMPISPSFSDISARASWPSLRISVVNWFTRSAKIPEIGRLVSMYAIGAPPTFASGSAGFALVDRFAGISQEPRQPQADQHNSSNDRGRLLAAQIADKSSDFVEIGVAQQVRDALEPGCGIVHVARRLRELL